MSLAIKNIQCPVCAGVVQFRANRQICRCLYCSTSLLVPTGERCPRYLLPPVLEGNDVNDRIKNSLRGGRVTREFFDDEEEFSQRLLFLPLFQLKGTSFVTVEKVVTKDKSVDTVVSLRNIVYHEFATSEGQVELSNIDLTSLSADDRFKGAIPFDRTEIPEDAQVFTADKSAKQIKAGFQQNGVGKQLKRGVYSELFGSEVSLYYYPFWVVRYPFNGSYYRFVVDGLTGQIIKGRAPENRLWSSLVAQALLLLSALVSYALVHFLSESGVYRQLTTFGALVTVIFSLMPLSLLYGVWLRLWFGRDILVLKDELHLQPIYKKESNIFEVIVETAEELVCFLWSSIGLRKREEI